TLDPGIVDGANNEFQGKSVDGMCKGTQFPSAEVRRHEDYAAATTQTLEIILEAIVNNEPADVLFVQLAKVGELDKQAAEVLKTSPQDSFSFVVTQLRKCDAKISHAGAPLPACKMETKPAQDFGGSLCDVAWHRAKGPHDQQCDGVFGDAFNAPAH